MKRIITPEQLKTLTPIEIGKFTSMFGAYTVTEYYKPNNDIYIDDLKYGHSSQDICELFSVGNMIEYLRHKYTRLDIRCEAIHTVAVFDDFEYHNDYSKYRSISNKLADSLFEIVSKTLKGVAI